MRQTRTLQGCGNLKQTNMADALGDHVFGHIEDRGNGVRVLVAACDQFVGLGPIEGCGRQVGHKILNPLGLVGHFARQKQVILWIDAAKGRQSGAIRLRCGPDICVGEGEDGVGIHAAGLAAFGDGVTGMVWGSPSTNLSRVISSLFARGLAPIRLGHPERTGSVLKPC